MKTITLIVLIALAGLTPVRAAEPQQPVFRMSLPGCRWAVEAAFGNAIQIRSHTFDPAIGERQMVLAMTAVPITVTIAISVRRRAPVATAIQLRDDSLAEVRRSNQLIRDVSSYERGGAAYFEYTTGLKPDSAVGRHITVFRTRGDTVVIVHLLKTGYRYEDDADLYRLLNHVGIVEQFTPDLSDIIIWADYAYLHKEWADAIAYYERALALDSAALARDSAGPAALSIADWSTSVDHLGDAYRQVHRLDDALREYRMGISRNPDYAIFEYNLACIFAEQGQADSTLTYLETAFKNEWKLPSGMYLPEPKDEHAFRHLRKTRAFRALMRKYER